MSFDESHIADVVIWDSHPLALGATPVQVIIDGIPQLSSPQTVPKPASKQQVPQTPDFETEAKEAVQYEGLPPLGPLRSRTSVVVFTNVSAVLKKAAGEGGVLETFASPPDSVERATVVVQNGKIICEGTDATLDCASYLREDDYTVVNLNNGALQPGLVSVGSTLGLQEIAFETSTTDGVIFDPLTDDPPRMAGGVEYMPIALDGVQFGTRDAL